MKKNLDNHDYTFSDGSFYKQNEPIKTEIYDPDNCYGYGDIKQWQYFHSLGIGCYYLKICDCGTFYLSEKIHSKGCCNCTNVSNPKINKETKRKYNKTYYEKHKTNHIEKICLVCGNEFIAKRKTKTTCSDKCRKALSRVTTNNEN